MRPANAARNIKVGYTKDFTISVFFGSAEEQVKSHHIGSASMCALFFNNFPSLFWVVSIITN